MKTEFLKPSTQGLIVPNPQTGKPLAEDGESVTIDRYWSRRLKDGDVKKAKPKTK